MSLEEKLETLAATHKVAANVLAKTSIGYLGGSTYLFVFSKELVSDDIVEFVKILKEPTFIYHVGEVEGVDIKDARHIQLAAKDFLEGKEVKLGLVADQGYVLHTDQLDLSGLESFCARLEEVVSRKLRIILINSDKTEISCVCIKNSEIDSSIEGMIQKAIVETLSGTTRVVRKDLVTEIKNEDIADLALDLQGADSLEDILKLM